MLTAIIGGSLVAVSWAIKIFGFPSQIKKIKKSKSTKGISKAMFYLTFLSYLLGSTYAILKNDWVYMATQFVGVFVAGYLSYYIFLYRNEDE